MYVCMYVHTYYVLIKPPMPYIASSPLCLRNISQVLPIYDISCIWEILIYFEYFGIFKIIIFLSIILQIYIIIYIIIIYDFIE